MPETKDGFGLFGTFPHGDGETELLDWSEDRDEVQSLLADRETEGWIDLEIREHTTTVPTEDEKRSLQLAQENALRDKPTKKARKLRAIQSAKAEPEE